MFSSISSTLASDEIISELILRTVASLVSGVKNISSIIKPLFDFLSEHVNHLVYCVLPLIWYVYKSECTHL